MLTNSDLKNKTITGFMWKLLHNFGGQIISLVTQIIIARILLPESYGIIALTSIFTAIGFVVIQGAFTPSIIQKKDISQVELSSIYYTGLMISIVFVAFIFLFSPVMARFYEQPILTIILRVQSLNILIGAFYSVHQALMYRNMDYKNGFFAGILAISVQGAIGIILAVYGFEVWSLVIAQLSYTLSLGITIVFITKWRPIKAYSVGAIASLYSFSSRLFIISFMNAIYTNLVSLFIGKIYNSETLGYYYKGYGFPTMIMNNFDGAMNHVLFTSLSKLHEQPEERLNVLRRSLKTSIYISAPAMIGLIVIAEPLILVLLTDKWLQAVPFLQLTALGCLIWPLSARIQAINAMGRSDISLRINLLLRAIGVALIIIFSNFNIYWLVLSTMIGEFVIAILTSFVVKNLIGYQLKAQMMDIFPSILLSLVMASLMWPLAQLDLNAIVLLTVQVVGGVMVYGLLSWLFKLDSFTYLIQLSKHYINQMKNRA